MAYQAHLERLNHHAARYYNSAPHPSKLAAAHNALKNGFDEDWRASVQRYPEVLQYYYSLVVLQLPADDEPVVKDPPELSALRGGNLNTEIKHRTAPYHQQSEASTSYSSEHQASPKLSTIHENMVYKEAKVQEPRALKKERVLSEFAGIRLLSSGCETCMSRRVKVSPPSGVTISSTKQAKLRIITVRQQSSVLPELQTRRLEVSLADIARNQAAQRREKASSRRCYYSGWLSRALGGR